MRHPAESAEISAGYSKSHKESGETYVARFRDRRAERARLFPRNASTTYPGEYVGKARWKISQEKWNS